jgi:hypothetical protein
LERYDAKRSRQEGSGSKVSRRKAQASGQRLSVPGQVYPRGTIGRLLKLGLVIGKVQELWLAVHVICAEHSCTVSKQRPRFGRPSQQTGAGSGKPRPRKGLQDAESFGDKERIPDQLSGSRRPHSYLNAPAQLVSRRLIAQTPSLLQVCSKSGCCLLKSEKHRVQHTSHRSIVNSATVHK